MDGGHLNPTASGRECRCPGRHGLTGEGVRVQPAGSLARRLYGKFTRTARRALFSSAPVSAERVPVRNAAQERACGLFTAKLFGSPALGLHPAADRSAHVHRSRQPSDKGQRSAQKRAVPAQNQRQLTRGKKPFPPAPERSPDANRRGDQNVNVSSFNFLQCADVQIGELREFFLS